MRFLLTLLLLVVPVSASAMSFEVTGLPDMQWVRASGAIDNTDAVTLEMIINEHPGLHWIIFDSPGGSLLGGVNLGRAARRADMATIVPDGARCLSACFFAFVGGTTRVVGNNGRLGVHQFYGTQRGETASEAQARTQRVAAKLYEYVAGSGVSIRALAKAMKTPPGMMLIFSRQELERLDIVTDAGVTGLQNTARTDCPFPPGYPVNDPLKLYPACEPH